MNRISIFFNHVVDFAKVRGIGIDEALAETKAMGYDGITLDIAFLQGDDGAKCERLIRASGLRVMAIWSGVDFIHSAPEECDRKICALLETARGFGCGNVLVLPGTFLKGDDKKAGLAKIYAGLNGVCEKAKKYGIDVTIEDFGIGDAPNGNIAGCADFFKNIPDLKFTLDTGNFTLYHENPFDAYEALKDKIAYVHLKEKRFVTDANGNAGEEELAVGDGDLQLGKLMRKMIDEGYRGDFAVEHFGAADQESAMRRSAAYCRGILGGIQR